MASARVQRLVSAGMHGPWRAVAGCRAVDAQGRSGPPHCGAPAGNALHMLALPAGLSCEHILARGSGLLALQTLQRAMAAAGQRL